MKEIKITGRYSTAMIDDEDYDRVSKFTWYLSKNNYVYCTKWKLNLYLHRFIVNAPKGSVVDHIDRNQLNNQKSNLRICTQVENGNNRGRNKNNKSGYKGVSFIEGRFLSKPWRANLKYNGVVHNLGNYSTPEEAALAYNNAVKLHLDNKAFVNDIKNV